MALKCSLLPALRYAVVASICFKLLLYPAYRSTDFEVHRNWLAITYSKPLKEWYYEDTSEWTLDYPPFFAYFEWFLSQFAQYADPGMLVVGNLDYASTATVYFQRTSEIVSELVLVYGLQNYFSLLPDNNRQPAYAIAMSIYFSPGFLIIDNIHFQYNAMLFGILVWSLVAMKQQRMLRGAVLFAVLLCFKHIFLYLAPAYFAYLLRVYCLDLSALSRNSLMGVIRWKNSILLGLSVISVALIAFSPFIYLGQVPQIFKRLFPFSRGLCHAYWAPNVWALYSATDRVLFLVFRKVLKNPVYADDMASLTRGLVGISSFNVLPDVQPRTTFLLTTFYQLIALIPMIITPTHDKFVGALALCGFASFLFGWHVHEKAILLVIVPFSFLALKDRRYLTPFYLLTVSGYISLFPLIFTSPEAPIKYLYTFAWIFAFYNVFDGLAPVRTTHRVFLLDRIAHVFLLGFIPLLLFVALYDKFAIFSGLEFLRLMLISTYCSLGIIGSFVGFSWLYLFT
ncbi:glycosyl transferase [Lipomyces tetrasporus]|uniref:Alpha-1,3-glucosyltransferase n=1 Tax=Lipomyces tetrasporus TaxID=54092 RepID=A0AAD7QMM6_9ASCO|nr:glycosyl transferase [Lipomyces tetrasporus]KAJ8096707.1 glycosyl transferase [Lipomyces tetrasporus]